MKYARWFISFVLLVIGTNTNINAGSESMAQVQFYGHEVSVPVDFALTRLNLTQLNQESVSNLFNESRNFHLNASVNKLNTVREDLKLDDLGMTLLVDALAKAQYPASKTNESVFLKYLLLKQLGYDVLLTRHQNKLNCLGNLSFRPARYLYIQYNGITYIDLDFKKRETVNQHFIFKDNLRTYRTISRNPLVTPRLNAQKEERSLFFRFGMDTFNVQVRSNRSLMDYLEDLPMFKLGKDYSRTGMSSDMQETLIPYLKEHTAGMTKADQVKFLLAFVQQSISYGSDYTKYGEERYYYPEQTLMAATADCEDKTFLLSYLLKRVANLSSVALLFENDQHLSLAVEIPHTEDALAFNYKGKSYLACEPTANSPRLGFSAFSLKRVTEVIQL